ncbi:MAG TPA: homoserine dehydrogenase, partial [Acidimicrobiia bacterium]|nr:homoserine dehydrogenase [Acidimicrobiia bacterium]
MQDPVRVGLLGCGNVGAPLVRLLADNADRIAARAGVAIEVTRVAVRDATRNRDVKISPDRFTTDAASVVTDPDVDVVVEVIGGVDPARGLITAALEAGKP